MNTIEYKGKQYPTRTFKVSSPEFGGEQTYTIGTDSLFEAFGDDYENHGTEANEVDNKIYFYVEDIEIYYKAKRIVEECLDIPMELIEEIFE